MPVLWKVYIHEQPSTTTSAIPWDGLGKSDSWCGGALWNGTHWLLLCDYTHRLFQQVTKSSIRFPCYFSVIQFLSFILCKDVTPRSWFLTEQLVFFHWLSTLSVDLLLYSDAVYLKAHFVTVCISCTIIFTQVSLTDLNLWQAAVPKKELSAYMCRLATTGDTG